MESVEQLTIKPRAKQDIEAELIGDELFLCDHSGDEAIHCLNSGAAIIWYLCDGTRSLQMIANEIAGITERSVEKILDDVQETVYQFQHLGLLEETE